LLPVCFPSVAPAASHAILASPALPAEKDST
jgi:hypothetical protein